MKILDVKQGSEEWFKARAGVVTASEFDNLISPEWKARVGQGRDAYLYRKLAERCMGIPLEQGGSWSTDQGKILEKEALPWVAFTRDANIERVGFITSDDGRIGCSPDGLIGDDGGIEAKCPNPDTHLKYLLSGEVPKEYRAQVYGSMYVTGRAWWYFLSYSRHFPPLLLKVERDEEIMDKIGYAIDWFLEDFSAAFNRIVEIKDETNADRSVGTSKLNPRYELA